MDETKAEGAAMMYIEKRAVTLPQLIGWAMIGLLQAFTAGVTWSNLNAANATQDASITAIREDRAAKRLENEKRFTSIEETVKDVPGLDYRLTQNEAQDRERDARLDRIVESVGDKIDKLATSFQELRSDVRVLSKQLVGDDAAKPTRFQ
jgi:hypothetical protein